VELLSDATGLPCGAKAENRAPRRRESSEDVGGKLGGRRWQARWTSVASSVDVGGKLGGRQWQAQGTSGGKFRGHVSGKLKGVNYIQSSVSAGDNGGLSSQGANSPYVVGNAQRKSKPRKPPAVVESADCGGGADRSAVSGRHSAAAANHSANPVRSIVRPLSASGATCRLAPTRARREVVDFFDRVSVRRGVPHNQRVTAPARVRARARPPEHAREWTRCRWPPRGQGRPAARAPRSARRPAGLCTHGRRRCENGRIFGGW